MYSESNKTELKIELIENVKKEIIAFLNTDGGVIYIGVNDDGSVVGIYDRQERDSLELKLSNWIQDAIYPIPSSLVNYYFNEDNVFVIEVSKGDDKPYYLKEKGPKPSGVFKRVGSSVRKANDSEILLMILESKDYRFESDLSEEQDLTFKYFNQICDENDIKHEERNLRSLGLLNKENKYTNLGLLLSDQSPITVKFAKYDKNLNFLVKKEFKGSLLKCLDLALENSANYNDVSAIIDNTSWKRIETISYPGASLREAILNAFAHANYFIRSNIKLEFYEDKVKITNPGGIFQATLEQIFDGVQTYRNPGLVNILSKLQYIENFGTGIPRILHAYENSKRQPEFLPSESFFILKMPNMNFDPINDSLNDPIKDPINQSQKIDLSDFDLSVVRVISEKPGLNTKQIVEELNHILDNVTIDMVKNSLKRKLINICEFKGSRRNGGYYLKR